MTPSRLGAACALAVLLLPGCPSSRTPPDDGGLDVVRDGSPPGIDGAAADASPSDAGARAPDASPPDAGPPDAGAELPCVLLPTTETREQMGPLDRSWRAPTGPSCPSALGAEPSAVAAVRFCNESDASVGLTIVAPPSASFLTDGLERPITLLYAGATLPADATDCIAIRTWTPDAAPLTTALPAHGSVVMMIGESAPREAGRFYFFYSAAGAL